MRKSLVSLTVTAAAVLLAATVQADPPPRVSFAPPPHAPTTPPSAAMAAVATPKPKAAPLSAGAVASAKLQVADTMHPTATAGAFGTSSLYLDPQHLTEFVGWFRGDLIMLDASMVMNDIYVPATQGGVVAVQYRMLPSTSVYLLDCAFAGTAPVQLTDVKTEWHKDASGGAALFQTAMKMPIVDGHLLYGFASLPGTGEVIVNISVAPGALFDSCRLHSVP